MLVGLISNVIIFPPTFLLILLFKKGKKSQKRKNRIDFTIEKLKQNGVINWNNDKGYKRNTDLKNISNSWPSYMNSLGWFLSFVCISGGSFMVYAYGITFGNEKTRQWIVSMISSFFASLLISQPIQVLIPNLNSFRATNYENSDHSEWWYQSNFLKILKIFV